MIALELLPDGLHAHAGHLADNVHRHLPRRAHIRIALLAADVRRHHIVGARDLVQDLLDRDRDRLAVVQRVLDRRRRYADARLDALQQIVGVQFLDCALQLADILLQVVRNVLGHVVRQVQIQQLGLALDDGNARFKIRRLDVGGQAPLKPGAQTLLQGFDLLRGAVRRDDDLAAIVVQRVEGVEKLLLRALLAGQELDVVDQKHVRLAVALAELLHRCRLDGGDRLVREFFTIHVDNVEIRVVLLDLNFDGVQQVRLAQTRRPVDEQRVVRAGGVRGHGLRGGKRKLVRRPLDEVLERELVPPAGQVVLVQLRLLGSLAAVRCGRGQHKLQLHLKAEDRGKRLLEQICIARRRKPHDDVVGNLQDDDVRALKIQQIEVLDENSV